ncbi:MAG: chromate transporter [Oscillospiraceae bacterium]|nr:chromate transporter [Oscillospiraceae bacterium]
MIYLQVFLSFLQIGLFSFGGGYAALPLIQNQTVYTHNWLTMTEFADIVTISQMTPGPIAINAATFTGMRLAGLWGAAAATLGCVLPSTIICIILAKLYYKYREMSIMKGIMNGLRPAVVAMIASAGLSIMIQALYPNRGISFTAENLDFIAITIFIATLLVLRIFKLNQITVMAAAGILGGAAYLLIH